MPVMCSKDKDGCFCRWGQEGAKYYYKCGSPTAKTKAENKAAEQGRAIEAQKDK
jgi:hypothetical protein